MDKKFLLRTSLGDKAVAAEAELRELLQKGQCRPADFLYDFAAAKWSRVGDHAAVAELFATKPVGVPDRRVIYVLPAGGTPAGPLGPFSTKEIQARAQDHEVCGSSWVFVEGDKEWRQVRNVKILNDMLLALPTDVPAVPAEAPPPAAAPSGPPAFSLSAVPGGASFDLGSASLSPPEPEQPSMPSIALDLGASALPETPPPAPPSSPAAPASSDEPYIEREESTLAIDTMGLNLHAENLNLPPPSAPPPRPAKPSIMPAPGGPPSMPPPGLPRAAPPASVAGGQEEHFDGIVAEIPTDPIWLVKQATGEAVSGPFRFLEVIKFLEEGKLTKNDKIARTGNKAFGRIGQQYEFNVKFSLETVIENGQEKQKILIRRRHPRVPYMTGVQIVSKHGLLAGQCVNISAGGILMEVPKADFNLGDIIEVKILPGLIAKSITCKSLIIGKIPKIPPGYALKFEDLKPEDKEAIEYYVQETLKREMQKKN